MPVPSYGAAPLAKFFLMTRGLELFCMVFIVGFTANFVAEINSQNATPPREVVGTLSVVSVSGHSLQEPAADRVKTSLAALYCLVSIAFFWAQANLGLFIMTAIDFLILIAFIVVSVVVGKPLSVLNCMAVDNASAAENAASATAMAQSLSNTLPFGDNITLFYWAGNTRANCYETKAIWGFSISLAILFFTSCLILPTLWHKAKKAGGGFKEVA
ncbi:MAG: hypothetical protein M1820_010182 [Bogoriella megaspora]|nr:MAG: hypothetical protein M1820_010182 [Bogoriella megaspora]